MQSAVPIPRLLPGQLHQLFLQSLVAPFRSTTKASHYDRNQPANPALAGLVLLFKPAGIRPTISGRCLLSPLQHLAIKTEIGDQSLQSRVLIFQLTQTLRLVHFQAAVLGLPRLDCVLENYMLSGYILGRGACFDLLQRSDELRLRVPALAHTLSSIRNHTCVCADLAEQVMS